MVWAWDSAGTTVTFLIFSLWQEVDNTRVQNGSRD